ncbi:DeoR/GlpR transcriptional regulator [Anaerococcus sp. AGMB00486]|uniref:DeoR/GlpR transcriptional regulator n=1 Tax=Anaerococcus faecalis TaxID=2742993 RepID=A0ABX2N8U2_9FIRM|nr:DeoR/GlpR family DNA-binding transcription regulator [Anaerococcus faecalis]NVF11117.1 DeoR/GlpR transcriptional regulator [Anaerococcus faecalis]
MSNSIRLNEIESLLEIKNQITVSEISDRWSITDETARRDLDKLVLKGCVRRVHGGAIWVKDDETNKSEIDFYKRQIANTNEKKKIALFARDIIKNKRTLFCDSSTTCVETLKSLKNDKNLTIVTNSCAIFREIKDFKPNIISTGGIYNKNTISFHGETAERTIENYHAELSIISCRGVDIINGITDSYDNESSVKKKMIKCANEVALLVDNSKFNKTAFIRLTDLKFINYIITDSEPNIEWVNYCKDNNIKLLY